MVSDFLLSDYFVWTWCAGIVVSLIFYIYRLEWAEARQLRSKLNECKARTDGIDGEAGFVEAFENYDSEMGSKFGTPWQEFVETLVLPASGSADPIRNTRSVSLYLNDASIIFPNISFERYRSVPNRLTGFGILGTFSGLAIGVGAASAGLTSGDSQQVTESLRLLLDGASLAFITSIFGIVCSMVFGSVERRVSRSLHLVLDAWVQAIETRLERVTSESVALQQLAQAERATEQLERFNTELIISLEQALDENIAGRLSPQLDRLVEAVQGLRSDRSSDAGEMIAQVLGQFTNAMQEQTGSAFEELAAIISGLNRTLEDATDGMAQSQREIRMVLKEATSAAKASIDDGARAMTKTLEQSLDIVAQGVASTSSKLVEQLTSSSEKAAAELRVTIGDATASLATAAVDAVSKISGTVSGLESGARSLDRSTQQSQEVLSQITAFVDHFDTLGHTIATAQRRMADVTVPITRAASATETASQRIAAALGDTQSLVDRIGANVKALEQHQGEVANAWQKYQDRFEGIDNSLGRVFQQIDEGLSGYCEQVREFANQLDKTASKTIRDLAGATHDLGQSIEDLTEHLGRRA